MIVVGETSISVAQTADDTAIYDIESCILFLPAMVFEVGRSHTLRLNILI